MYWNLHTHTCYSDGANSPEEMVLAAIEKGMPAIGISDHVYTHFDESYCMKKERVPAYLAEIGELKKKYCGKIKVLCGIEQDMFAAESTEAYDYVIGSVHYLKVDGEYVPVDEDPQLLREAADRYFGGNGYELAECYFDTESRMPEMIEADIIGHFDLISKFAGVTGLFDENSPRYKLAWKHAADKLLQYGIPFEINTSSMWNGYKKEPYLNGEMIEYIQARGGRFVMGSDSHCTASLCFCFEEFLPDQAYLVSNIIPV